MRKIHKKLLDFSYTFFSDIGREGGREGGKKPRTKLLLYAYAGCLDGWTMDVRTLPTHTHIRTHMQQTGTHNRGKLGRNIFKAIFLMRYRLMVCCLSWPRDDEHSQQVTEAALLVTGYCWALRGAAHGTVRISSIRITYTHSQWEAFTELNFNKLWVFASNTFTKRHKFISQSTVENLNWREVAETLASTMGRNANRELNRLTFTHSPDFTETPLLCFTRQITCFLCKHLKHFSCRFRTQLFCYQAHLDASLPTLHGSLKCWESEQSDDQREMRNEQWGMRQLNDFHGEVCATILIFSFLIKG